MLEIQAFLSQTRAQMLEHIPNMYQPGILEISVISESAGCCGAILATWVTSATRVTLGNEEYEVTSWETASARSTNAHSRFRGCRDDLRVGGVHRVDVGVVWVVKIGLVLRGQI